MKEKLKSKIYMDKVTSISGGMTSAYLAVHYPTKYNVFSLVRTSDKKCIFPDKKIRSLVADRIGKPFIGTLEDDTIIYTILDLEQKMGKKISWVSGITFDEVIKKKGGYLPNKIHRYCTTFLKIEPIFYWWSENIGKPIEVQIGYRANEGRRVKKMKDRLNENGLLEYKATFGKWESGRNKGQNKWQVIEWQKPIYPLYYDRIFKDQIVNYWAGQNVRFAKKNNCVGCFHQTAMLLKKRSIENPIKFNWFAEQEGIKEGENKNTWKSYITYKKIRNNSLQIELDFDDFSECDSGYCEL